MNKSQVTYLGDTMDKLKIAARHYANVMARDGIHADQDDVLGELALTHCIGQKMYRAGDGHEATETTYLATCYANSMLAMAKTIRLQQMNELHGDAEQMADDGTFIRLEVKEAVTGLNAKEKTVLRAMLQADQMAGLEIMRHGNGRRDQSIAKATGLEAKTVKRAMAKIKAVMLDIIK